MTKTRKYVVMGWEMPCLIPPSANRAEDILPHGVWDAPNNALLCACLDPAVAQRIADALEAGCPDCGGFWRERLDTLEGMSCPNGFHGAAKAEDDEPATNGGRQEDVEDGKPLSDGRAFYVEDGA